MRVNVFQKSQFTTYHDAFVDYDAFVVDSVNEPYLSGILQFAYMS